MIGTRIYIIRFHNGKRYIFESDILSTQVVDYLNGLDLEWVQMNLPAVVVSVVPDCECDVDRYVLKHMKHLGIDQVRGGSYSHVNLSGEEIKNIKKKIKKCKNIFCQIKKLLKRIRRKIHNVFSGKHHICVSQISTSDITSLSSESEVEVVCNL